MKSLRSWSATCAFVVGVVTLLINAEVAAQPVKTPCFKNPQPVRTCPAVPTTQCDGTGTIPAVGCAGGGILSSPTCTGGTKYAAPAVAPVPDRGPCQTLPVGGAAGNDTCVTDAARGSPTITCYTYQSCTGGPCARLNAASPWLCTGPPAGAPVMTNAFLGARLIGAACRTPNS